MGPRKYRYHSPLISSEWCAFTNYPWGRGLINFEEHEEAQALETYRTWLRLFQLQRYYSWIVDRFHISTQLFQKTQFNRSYDFTWLEEGLLELGFHLILCTRPNNSFEAARDERLAISGNPGQYDDLDIFRREQAGFRDLALRSSLPTLELDVSSEPLDELCEEIADWLESTGGLWMNE